MVESIKKIYEILSPVPGGKLLFSFLIGVLVPYSGTVRPRVVSLGRQYAKVKIKDTWQVRNHLKSVHAIAMMNLAELSTGLALHFDLPKNMRGILTHLEIDYLKKGRGTLTAECRADIETSSPGEKHLEAVIKDAAGDKVALAKAVWLLSVKQKKTQLK